MNTTLILFLAFIAVTLGITAWASRLSGSSASYFAANRRISAWQNGVAVAGDYMSAASFLGIAGLIAFFGYDGFMYSVGWLVAYLTVLLIVAEPLRNAGKYTMADVLAYRLHPRPVRAMASLSTITVSTFYMIAQMVGAGALVALLLKGSGIGFSLGAFFTAVSQVHYHAPDGTEVVKDFLTPGLRYKPPYGALDLLSLGIALIFGTAGLPHILVRFYTVPDAKTARFSVVWAMWLIGIFYILTTFLGWGAATIVGRDFIAKNGGNNMSAPLLANALGGPIFFAFISAIAFATILAVVAGLTISASTSFAHDVWTNIIRHGQEHNPGEERRVARIAAFVVGAISIAIAIVLGPTANVAFLVALAFAVAASANLPVILFSIFWKRFNTAGAVAGLATGLLASIVLIFLGPSIMAVDAPTVAPAARHIIQHAPIFPLENPGILSIPLGFLGAIVGTLSSKRDPAGEEKFAELQVRANTGLGAEKAVAH